MADELDLDAIEAREEAATPGPWENEGAGEIGQHWSRPEPWTAVVSTSVACMSFCYGGSAEGVIVDADAEFIAHARADVPALVRRVRELESAYREGYLAAFDEVGIVRASTLQQDHPARGGA